MSELEPQIAELLRTCIHPASLRLSVARVEQLDLRYGSLASNTDINVRDAVSPGQAVHYALKLLLTDGELMIQALFHRRLSGLLQGSNIEVGAILNITRFRLKKSPRINAIGKVVFLAIEECDFQFPILEPSTEQTSSQKLDDVEQALKRKREDEVIQTSSKLVLDHGEVQEVPSELHSPKRAKIKDSDVLSVPSHNHPPGPRTNTHLPQRGDLSSNGHLVEPKVTLVSEHGQNSKRIRSKEKKYLERVFGARTILPDDDDEDDEGFFETSKEVRRGVVSSAKSITKSVFRNVAVIRNSAASTTNPEDKLAALEKRAPLKQEGNKAFSIEAHEVLELNQADDSDGSPSLQATKPHEDNNQRQVVGAFHQTVSSARPHAQPSQQPLLSVPPFHTLHTLRNPPASQTLPPKNYALTTLAIVSWAGTSLIHRQGSPFPPKRHLKIVDPSLTASRPTSRGQQVPTQQQPQQSSSTAFKAKSQFQDAITVAVYISAADFKPYIGTIALFRGLVMQRLGNGDVILNAYARLKDQRFVGDNEAARCDSIPVSSERHNCSDDFKHWFITDETTIRALGYGSRFDYYKDWWAEKQKG